MDGRRKEAKKGSMEKLRKHVDGVLEVWTDHDEGSEGVSV